MKAARSIQRTASPLAYLQRCQQKRKGYANWRFIPGMAEKAVLGSRRAPTLAEKPKSPKSLTFSQEVDVMGVTRPSLRLAVCQWGYTRFSATMRPRQRITATVGAKSDPLHGCAVNMAERDSRLTRLHCPSVVALTGEEAMAGGQHND